MNRDILRYSWIVGLLLLLCGGAALADDFDPENPPDPQRPADPPSLYQITVTATCNNNASGTGKYQEGQDVYINTSAASTGFKFLYWTKDGECYTTSRSFYYNVGTSNVDFVAVWEYAPDNPLEPEVPAEKLKTYILLLNSQPAGICSFNMTSGMKHIAGASLYISASANQGFVFKGWFEGETKVSDNSSFYYSMPATNTTLTAHYVYEPENPGEPINTESIGEIIDNTPRYKITFILDGKVLQEGILREGALIDIPQPIKEGYTFSGWSEIPETMPAHDVTVTGSFSINSYTLTYKVDGEAYKTSSVVFGTALTSESEPTKEGYTFSGWSEIPETMPANDVVISGTFSINSYNLIYMVDGVVYKTYSVVYGTELTPEVEPTKEGYTFSGWSEIPETMPAKDVVITGSFTVNSYLLTYMVDGEVYKSDSTAFASTITPLDSLVKEGYTFSGWSEIPETMPAKDVVVTGTFKINKYLLTYKVDGEIFKADSIVYNSALTPIAEPTKEGYTFSGWSEVPETMPAHDVVVTGSFSINKYLLTYKVDGDTFKSDSIVYGTALTLIAEPVKEGYTFSGWSEIPETMPANDVTVTGTFTINKYLVTFRADNEIVKSDSLTFGAAITAPVSPEKEGYTFVGWKPEVDATVPARDVT